MNSSSRTARLSGGPAAANKNHRSHSSSQGSLARKSAVRECCGVDQLAGRRAQRPECAGSIPASASERNFARYAHNQKRVRVHAACGYLAEDQDEAGSNGCADAREHGRIPDSMNGPQRQVFGGPANAGWRSRQRAGSLTRRSPVRIRSPRVHEAEWAIGAGSASRRVAARRVTRSRQVDALGAQMSLSAFATTTARGSLSERTSTWRVRLAPPPIGVRLQG